MGRQMQRWDVVRGVRLLVVVLVVVGVLLCEVRLGVLRRIGGIREQ